MTPPNLTRRLTGRSHCVRNTRVIGACSNYQTLIAPSHRSNVVALICPAKAAPLIGACPIGDHHMRSVRPGWPRALSARRLVLLATVAGLGVAGATIGPNALHQTGFQTYAAANATEIAQRPAGFADLVEKVKPAVISVRVKVKAGSEMMSFDGDMPSPPNSQMQRFFHHFGMPEGEIAPDDQGPRHDQFVIGQGSGFFITADGYAVTNNHVVDKAKAVEITTDEGKVYDAKVIGTDSRTDLALIKVDS